MFKQISFATFLVAACVSGSALSGDLDSLDELGGGLGALDKLLAEFPVDISQEAQVGAIFQQGSGNAAMLAERGGLNKAVAIQYGDHNEVFIQQAGLENIAVISQVGSRNQGEVLQYGSSNTALISQAGHNNSASIQQYGNGLYGFVAQFGGNNAVQITQSN